MLNSTQSQPISLSVGVKRMFTVYKQKGERTIRWGCPGNLRMGGAILCDVSLSFDFCQFFITKLDITRETNIFNRSTVLVQCHIFKHMKH